MAMKNQTQGATPPANVETKPTKSISVGVRVGRIAEKLLELDDQEREALMASPATIKAAFDKKREAALKELTEEQREAARGMAKALRPQVKAAAE